MVVSYRTIKMCGIMKKMYYFSSFLLICCLISFSVHAEKYPTNETVKSKITVSIKDNRDKIVKIPDKSVENKDTKSFPQTGENRNYSNLLIGLASVCIAYLIYFKKK